MIELLLTSNFNRSEMIGTLNISRGTFYRWLSDLRVQAILKKFEEANLKRITVEFQKRWQERIKVTLHGPKRELIYSPPPNNEEMKREEFRNIDGNFRRIRKMGEPVDIQDI